MKARTSVAGAPASKDASGSATSRTVNDSVKMRRTASGIRAEAMLIGPSAGRG